ncbi:MAG TPA: DMT family transporter [Baekduia sp.]|uniref:DMT family transporter n=1 Tax=Baekduia sp. TaxID=2600305 RepID=UPI002D1B6BA2|nr:DMT family transporter [Baekduia sp.]HMJ36838.1 DMT family transporter [Baekduia sp.]
MSPRAWFSLAFTAALWGASYMFIKVALDDGLSEGFIICARTILGALVLVPLAMRAGAVRQIVQRRWWALALAAAQVVVPFGLITFGENHVPSSLAGILVATAPLFVALLAIRVDPAERSHGWGLVGVVLGMVGVVLLFGVDLSGDVETLVGGLMIVGAGACYAVAVLIAKRAFTGVPPVGVAASNLVISAVIWLPVALVSLPHEAPGANAVLSMVALGAGGTGLAFLFFYTSIAEVGPARASVVAYVAPAFAVIYGVVLLDESLTLGTIGGLLLILAGSWLAAQGELPSRLSRSEPSRSTAPEPARVR